MTDTPAKDSIIVCVPGPWETRQDFVTALVGASDGAVIAAGLIMLDTEADMAWGFNFMEADPGLPEAFAMASVYNPLTEEEGAALAAHKSIVYIYDKRYGTDAVISAGRCASALLKAGGLGVKLEIAGRAFAPSTWLQNQPATEIGALTMLHDLFVFPVISMTHTSHFSSGMTQFGLPDTGVSGMEDLNAARELITAFNLFQMHEAPTLKSGETFSLGPDNPKYKLELQSHPYGDAEHIDFSPGLWMLAPL